MPVINSGMKKVIKGMVVTCQTAQFISLMPKPKDFVTRIVGDVVYLSAQVQKLSDDINRLLDSYADIPANYLMTQVNSITGSLEGINNRLDIFSQAVLDQGYGLGENLMETVSTLTGDVIDTVGTASQAVASLGLTVAQASSAVLGQEDVATHISDATEVVLEWIDGGFKTVSSNAVRPFNNAVQSIKDAKYNAKGIVNDTAQSLNNKIEDSRQWVENILKSLKEKMDLLAAKLDGGFKDVTGVTSIQKGASYVTEALKDSDNNSPSAQATLAVSQAVTKVLQNFSISKVIAAFGGVITQSVIVKTGLDMLPPIDFESMLNEVRSDLTMTNEERMEQLDAMIADMDDFNASLLDDRQYNSKRYNKYIEQFSEDIKKQRDNIRLSMKYDKNLTYMQEAKKNLNEQRAARSAIKEVRKFKRKVKNAKQADKLTGIIGSELDNLKKEVEYRSNSIKADWNDMMKQYKSAIQEISGFFKNGGDGDMFINDCCEAINDDCKKIKELCKNLITQLIASTVKIAMPADIGSLVPNPVYKIADFWMDIKTIIKFIKDLITLVLDILNNINKLARIMLNGINSLKEIIQQLLELLGLKWFMDLVQSIIDFFGGKMDDARALLANMIAPVYYRDTDEYDNTLEMLESMLSENDEASYTEDQLKSLEDPKRIYALKGSDIKSALKNEDKFEKFLDDLDEKGDEVVAYKSPIIAPTDSKQQSSNVSSLSDTSSDDDMDSDVKFLGWYFFHPNLKHLGYKPLFTKIKSKIIKKASKTGNKRRGGMRMLERKRVKLDTAKEAFYWYTYYTQDLEKDCFEWTTGQDMIKVDGVVKTQNGSIVELTDGRKVFVADNMVKSGDYVTVDGQKYRVK